MPKGLLKVPVRVATIRAVGAWYAQEIAAKPHLATAIRADTHKFLTGLARRSAKLLVMERSFAEGFVLHWRKVFRREWRNDLLLVPPMIERAPVKGLDALAELVSDIQVALKRPEGRQPEIDPIEALEVAQEAKKRRRNYPTGATKPYTSELAADALGVSVNTVEKAITQGKKIVRRVRAAIGEAELLAVLTKDGTSGAAIVQGEKRHLVVGAKKKT